MRWPWSTPGTGGAEARQQAEKHLAASEARRLEVAAVAASLRQLREQNGFKDKLQTILDGGRD